MPMTDQIDDKPVALITGASRGLGRAMALAFAQRGYHVIVNFRREAGEAEATLARIEQSGGSAELRQADVAQPAQVQQLFKGLRRLDVLVNNAGITRDELLLTMRRESWTGVLATNLGGLFHCAKLAARIMGAARRGVIVNIGSSSALSGRVGQANYSTAKSALLGFSRSVARELIGKGVRVVTVIPGFTATDMADAVPDEAAKTSLARIPLGRWGQPEEIVNAVIFAASEGANALHGQTILVDGGRTAFEMEMGL